MTSSIFLKKEERIIALGLVMCLSLLIYTLTQRKLRLELKKHGTTLPSQTGKPTKKPTMRWIYECFEGITVCYEQQDGIYCEFVANLQQLHMDILYLLGIRYQKIYEDTKYLTNAREKEQYRAQPCPQIGSTARSSVLKPS